MSQIVPPLHSGTRPSLRRIQGDIPHVSRSTFQTTGSPTMVVMLIEQSRPRIELRAHWPSGSLSVEPGSAGEESIPSSLKPITRLREMLSV